MLKPFATRDTAYYRGGGVLAEDVGGGWWSLHAQTHPNGVDLFHVGEGGKADGFPKTLKIRHIFATPDDGGPRTICRLAV